MSKTPSKFVWYELMTSDIQAAETFYKQVIGWDAKDAGMPTGPYTIVSVGSTMVGGIMAIPAPAAAMGARPAWLGYIGVDDVDAKTEKVKAAGGRQFVAPTDIPGVGRFSCVCDPQGAVFMLFKGNGEPDQAPPAPGTPGHIGWRELHAGEGVSAWEFYASQFGWTKGEAMDMGPMGVYQIFASGDASVGGMMTKTPETPMPHWLYYINVDAIDAAIARVNEAGGKVINGPMEVPGGMWIVQGMDPQGAVFALLAPKR
jgi:uncharacterized protein